MRRSKHLDIEDLLRSFAEPPPRACDHPACEGIGEFRAPRSKRELDRYYHFCLEHVRAYNQSWNYCDGMSDADVEASIRRDMCWQRPTWPLGRWGAYARFEAAMRAGQRPGVDGFDEAAAERAGAGQRADGADAGQAGADERARRWQDERAGAEARRRRRGDRAGNTGRAGAGATAEALEADALAVLGLRAPVTLAIVKLRYKELVRALHPDANGGDSVAEEQLKVVNHAYTILKLRLAEMRPAG